MDRDKDYRIIIKSLFRVLRPKSYLEVGCRSGETIKFLLKDIQEIGTKVYAIDISDVKQKLPKGINFILGNSFEIGPNWSIPLDMLFIDAEHKYESVMTDFQNFSKWVKDDGIILLHDTYPANLQMTDCSNCGDCWKSAWKIRNEMRDDFEIITLPIINGLSIIRKSKKQMKWQEI